ncbi:hypothetical protein JG687_00002827 [Phytophthora cactorum]|uniref:Uncharacterized protein n=1 Tax=Phytophthora cactorum TaxID=29920 RepID=A0A8T1UXE2_9STRA|nr:hypothetical protein GQ600_11321 [Phytophthora cactorum]KAG3022699.1 hypothetical protein PC120_g7980 [Phytophthora cactorum]KAG3074559.1 hypothetical protein PC121_g8325 [Phytophthora cactorum]KAG4062885.1 hypothetical protein PC123_g2322 [Phytophthora cactorum]KAG6970099.1 hypothetical protein JG687_00002827 [Phytophthora cactorum]
MIRPVSSQQMQGVGQPQLQSPSKPLKHSTAPSSKSPIKKHLQNASIGATELDPVPSSPLHGPLKAKLRASVLQAVLKLLDQDVNALAGAHQVLQAAAALPLSEPNVQRATIQALRGLHESMPPSFVYDSGSSSNSHWDAPIPPPSPRKQTMKAVQTRANSLHHCKKFLLACANEIHELEDVRPVNFDYAEDTSSSLNFALESCKNYSAANFDYASTVQSSIESDARSDDTRADQGSQLSDVLRRAEYMSDVDEMSMKDRVVCRKVLRALHEHAQTQRRRSSAPSLALKFRVFEALKLQASLTRKRIVFQRFKTGLRSRQQPISTAIIKTSRSLDFQTLMMHHSDVLLLILALMFLANLPAKYIM